MLVAKACLSRCTLSVAFVLVCLSTAGGERQPEAPALGDEGMSGISSHRFVFVGGPHHAGTTLTALLVGGHGDVSGFHNTGAPEDEGQHLQEVYHTALELGGMTKYAFNPKSHLTEQSAICTTRNRRKLFAAWAKYWDLSKPFLVEKSPPHIVMSRFIQAIFTPERTKFVFVIRHPLGATKFLWGKDRRGKGSKTCYIRLVGHWVKQMTILAEDLPYLRNATVIMYENFVAKSPVSNYKNLLHFLELEEASAAQISLKNHSSPALKKHSGSSRKWRKGGQQGRKLLGFHGNRNGITSGRAKIEIVQEEWMAWKRSFEEKTPGWTACGPMMAELEEAVSRFGYSLLSPDRVSVPLPFQPWLLPTG